MGAFLASVISMREPIREGGFITAVKTSSRWLVVALILGASGAGLGGVLGEIYFAKLKADNELLGRMLGLFAFGLFLGILCGLSEKIRTKSNERMLNTTLGGIIGGIVGGIIYRLLMQWTLDRSVLGLAFAAMGSALCASVGLIIIWKTAARLRGSTKNELKYAKSFIANLLSDRENRIGTAAVGASSPKSTTRVCREDPFIDDIHAVIKQENGRWYVWPYKYPRKGEETYVNEEKIQEKTLLYNGDELRFGNSYFTFELVKEKGQG